MFHRNNFILLQVNCVKAQASSGFVFTKSIFPFSLRPNLGLIKRTLLYQSHS